VASQTAQPLNIFRCPSRIRMDRPAGDPVCDRLGRLWCNHTLYGFRLSAHHPPGAGVVAASTTNSGRGPETTTGSEAHVDTADVHGRSLPHRYPQTPPDRPSPALRRCWLIDPLPAAAVAARKEQNPEGIVVSSAQAPSRGPARQADPRRACSRQGKIFHTLVSNDKPALLNGLTTSLGRLNPIRHRGTMGFKPSLARKTGIRSRIIGTSQISRTGSAILRIELSINRGTPMPPRHAHCFNPFRPNANSSGAVELPATSAAKE
jgi:hypothetical protein